MTQAILSLVVASSSLVPKGRWHITRNFRHSALILSACGFQKGRNTHVFKMADKRANARVDYKELNNRCSLDIFPENNRQRRKLKTIVF